MKTLQKMKIGDIVVFTGYSGDLQIHNPKRIIYSKRLNSLACQNADGKNNFSNLEESRLGRLWGSLCDCFIPPAHAIKGMKKIGFQKVEETKR